jgi:hypothetical protein
MEDYNGWTNRETWLVSVWFGDWIRAYVEEGNDLTCDYIAELVNDKIDAICGGSGFVGDMVAISESEINYQELYGQYVDLSK